MVAGGGRSGSPVTDARGVPAPGPAGSALRRGVADQFGPSTPHAEPAAGAVAGAKRHPCKQVPQL